MLLERTAALPKKARWRGPGLPGTMVEANEMKSFYVRRRLQPGAQLAFLAAHLDPLRLVVFFLLEAALRDAVVGVAPQRAEHVVAAVGLAHVARRPRGLHLVVEKAAAVVARVGEWGKSCAPDGPAR